MNVTHHIVSMDYRKPTKCSENNMKNTSVLTQKYLFINDIKSQFSKDFQFSNTFFFLLECEHTDNLGFSLSLSILFKSWLHHLLVM